MSSELGESTGLADSVPGAGENKQGHRRSLDTLDMVTIVQNAA